MKNKPPRQASNVHSADAAGAPTGEAAPKPKQHWLLDKIFMNQPWQQGLPAYVLMFLCVRGYYAEFIISQVWLGITLGMVATLIVLAGWRKWWFVEDVSIFIMGPVFGFLAFYGVGYGAGELAARVIGKPEVLTVRSNVEKHISSRTGCRNHLLLDDTAYYRFSNSFLCVYDRDAVPADRKNADFLIAGRSTFTGTVVDDITLAPDKPAAKDGTPAKR